MVFRVFFSADCKFLHTKSHPALRLIPKRGMAVTH